MKLPKTWAKDKNNIHVIIETPKKNRNKFAFDPDTKLFKLTKVLPFGYSFPFDMGFIPGTEGEDGDPLDALVLIDGCTYPGCLIECRLIGVIKGEQTEKDGTKIRNDRFIAVPEVMKDYDKIRSIKDIAQYKINAIIKFFDDYNKRINKKFTLIDIDGPEPAKNLLKKGRK